MFITKFRISKRLLNNFYINKLKSVVKVSVAPDEEDEYELVQVEDE